MIITNFCVLLHLNHKARMNVTFYNASGSLGTIQSLTIHYFVCLYNGLNEVYILLLFRKFAPYVWKAKSIVSRRLKATHRTSKMKRNE